MKEVLQYIGASGFLSVFQAAGCGLALAAWKHFKAEFKRRKPNRSDILSMVFGSPLILGFTLAPLAMAFEFGGWPGGVCQAALLVMIIAFVCVSGRAGDKSAPSSAETPEIKERPQSTAPSSTKNFLRALPGSLVCFYLAAAYVGEWIGRPIPGMTGDWLSALVKVEFLVIHSLPFLSLITLFRFKHRQWRFFQWYLFVSWYCLYLGFAFEIRDHWDVLPAFATATFGTYLGFMLQESKVNRVILVFKRWGVCFVLLVLASISMGANDWRTPGSLIKVGILYFPLIGAIELTPIYRIHWRKGLSRVYGRFRTKSDR